MVVKIDLIISFVLEGSPTTSYCFHFTNTNKLRITDEVQNSAPAICCALQLKPSVSSLARLPSAPIEVTTDPC